MQKTPQTFWQKVSERVRPGGLVLLLPHRASLAVSEANSEEEREAVRSAFTAVMRATVDRADRRLRQDLLQRGYRPVESEALAAAARALGLSEADWSTPVFAAKLARTLSAEVALVGRFRFQVWLLPRRKGAPPGARQEVRYTLSAIDPADASEIARSPLVHRWESLLPSSRWV